MTYLPMCAIFDVDGTLADVSGVRHYVTADPKKKNFQKFHGAASYVRPNDAVVQLAQDLDRKGIVIVVVTSRMEMWRYRTSTWLQKWNVPFDYLLMRRDHDERKDVEVKREILTAIREKYRVILAVDDNPAVIALWTAENIPTVVVPGWVVEPVAEVYQAP